MSKANKLWATNYYDYKSRRTRKETTRRAPQGAQGVVYHYDQDDNLLAETLATGAPIKTYLWDDGRLVGLLDHGTTPPTLLTLDLDQLGTPRAARTANGTVVWRWDSDGYGTTLPNEDPDGNGAKVTINLRFPGQYYDQESGLHYNWNRYYSPRLGRYISSDPIGLAGGPNLYSYVERNPISKVDPCGLFVGDPASYSTAVEGIAAATGVAASTVASVIGGVAAALYPSSTAVEPDDRPWRRPARWLGYVRCHVKKEAQCENCPDTIGGKAYGGTFDEANARAQMDANATLGYQNARNCLARHCQPVACFENGRRVACPMSGR